MLSHQPAPPSLDRAPARKLILAAWLGFCRLLVRVFYRRFEVVGAEAIPRDAGLLLCANHVNALADAVVLQASTSRPICPLARSGLFQNPLLRPVLKFMGAVPIYRRRQPDADPTRNDDSFSRCYRLLGEGETLIIFPEGQSHSDPHLRNLKTGAARIVLGARDLNGTPPVLMPVGLTFFRKGTFRGDVVVQYGQPVDLELPEGIDQGEAVALLTERLRQGLLAVTLNAGSWQEIDLARQVERFFALRSGKYRPEKLAQKVRALQRLIEGQQLLLVHEPMKVRALIRHLRRFERLCHCCGIRGDQPTVDPRPVIIAFFALRGLAVILLGLPAALWGIINSYFPFILTRHLARRVAHGVDQYDTSKILLGLVWFGLFWVLQVTVIHLLFGTGWALVYLASIGICAPVALKMRSEYHLIIDNLKMFVLFLRKHQVRDNLQQRRQEIERELARLIRVANRLSRRRNRQTSA